MKTKFYLVQKKANIIIFYPISVFGNGDNIAKMVQVCRNRKQVLPFTWTKHWKLYTFLVVFILQVDVIPEYLRRIILHNGLWPFYFLIRKEMLHILIIREPIFIHSFQLIGINVYKLLKEMQRLVNFHSYMRRFFLHLFYQSGHHIFILRL